MNTVPEHTEVAKLLNMLKKKRAKCYWCFTDQGRLNLEGLLNYSRTNLVMAESNLNMDFFAPSPGIPSSQKIKLFFLVTHAKSSTPQ